MSSSIRVECRLLPANHERLAKEAETLNLSLPEYIIMRALEPRYVRNPEPEVDPWLETDRELGLRR